MMPAEYAPPGVQTEESIEALGAIAGKSVLICDDIVHRATFEALATCLIAAGVAVQHLPFQADRDGTMDLTAPLPQSLMRVSDVLVMTTRHRCPAQALQHVPRIKGIAIPSVGTDSLDVAAATARGILIGHGGTDENTTGMAEATLMLVLHVLYQLGQSERLLREQLPRPQAPYAQQLFGKTIGIIGYGKIARRFIELLEPFCVEILLHSPSGRVYTLAPAVQPSTLDQLLARSDVVVLLAGATPENRHLLHRGNLSRVKPGAYLVNTARGSLIDSDALVDMLRKGRIAGAALDTFEAEPLPADHPLRALGNVILTPHIVGHTREAIDSLRSALIQNVVQLLTGKTPRFCRNPEAVHHGA